MIEKREDERKKMKIIYFCREIDLRHRKLKPSVVYIGRWTHVGREVGCRCLQKISLVTSLISKLDSGRVAIEKRIRYWFFCASRKALTGFEKLRILPRYCKIFPLPKNRGGGERGDFTPAGIPPY